MSLFKKGTETEEKAPKTKNTIGPEAHNHIGQGTELTGDLNAPGLLRVDGKVEGHIHCKAKAVFGNQSYLDGTLEAENAEIAGKIKGKVTIKELLVLKQTAKIEGDINTNLLIIEKGAQFKGNCQTSQTIDLEHQDQENVSNKKNKEAAAKS